MVRAVRCRRHSPDHCQRADVRSLRRNGHGAAARVTASRLPWWTAALSTTIRRWRGACVAAWQSSTMSTARTRYASTLTICRATSPATAPPAPASSIAWRRRPRSTACACWARTCRAAAMQFAGGLDWAVENGMQVINLSLSTSRREYYGMFHHLVDDAYFKNAVLVSAISNFPSASYPSQYSSVISVAAHEGQDPFTFYYNPHPPVEFGAPGIDVRVAWKDAPVCPPHWQQLCRASHCRHRRPHPRQASRADAVPDQVRPLGVRQQRAANVSGHDSLNVALYGPRPVLHTVQPRQSTMSIPVVVLTDFGWVE